MTGRRASIQPAGRAHGRPGAGRRRPARDGGPGGAGRPDPDARCPWGSLPARRRWQGEGWEVHSRQRADRPPHRSHGGRRVHARGHLVPLQGRPTASSWSFATERSVPVAMRDRDRPEELGVPLDRVARLVVHLGSGALRDLTLIDTPGLATLTEENEAHARAAILGDESSRYATGDADALLYVVREAAREDDVAFLRDFGAAFRRPVGVGRQHPRSALPGRPLPRAGPDRHGSTHRAAHRVHLRGRARRCGRRVRAPRPSRPAPARSPSMWPPPSPRWPESPTP